MKDQTIRLRFAPSPTGFLHIGGARTALFNYLFAKSQEETENGSAFILRIEDTDKERSTIESEKEMIESLEWLGLNWDEGIDKKGIDKKGEYGPYRQSNRIEIYSKYINTLLNENKAYHCFCTAEEIENKRQRSNSMGVPYVYNQKCRWLKKEEVQKKISEKIPYTIRFKAEDRKVIVKDIVQGNVTFDTSLVGDFIIQKANKFPSYNFAVVVDDHLMKISHIIRGVGHLSNTNRQILIYKAFGWEEPVWCHVGEIVNSNYKKLSKRNGSVSVMVFKKLGYTREAFINYISLLGWSPKNNKEFMSIKEIIKHFDIHKFNKSPSIFDVFEDENIENTQDIHEIEKKTKEKF